MIDIHDAIKEREDQLIALQTQISTIQMEIKALRVAARILEGGKTNAPEATAPGSAPVSASAGDDKVRAWP